MLRSAMPHSLHDLHVASATAACVVAGEFANNNCAQLAGVTRPRQLANGSIVKKRFYLRANTF
jgi:hypothetical protein